VEGPSYLSWSGAGGHLNLEGFLLPTWLEQTLGVLLLLFILADVFLAVLYARMGAGLLSPRLARIIWRGFQAVAAALGDRSRRLLSFGGPIILVTVLLVWALTLALGVALIIHPKLGTSVTAVSGTGLRRFQQAGSKTIADEQDGASTYVELRTEWDSHLKTLARALGYTVEEIDLATSRPEAAEQRPPVQARLRSAG
jgi:hypothetical protein